MVIEPYFDRWMNTKSVLSKKEPFFESLKDVWSVSSFFERGAFILFCISWLVTLASSLVAVFDVSIFPFYLATWAWRIEKRSGMASALQVDMKRIGLANGEQVRIVRDEAVRLLERKEHRRETVIRTSIDIFVIGAFVWVLNFSVTMLEHDLPLDTAAALVLLGFVAASAFVIAVAVICSLFDHVSGMPCTKLRSFIDDLSNLLIAEHAEVRSPARRRRPSRRSLS